MSDIANIFWAIGIGFFALILGGGWAQMNANPPDFTVARRLVWVSIIPMFSAYAFWARATNLDWHYRLLVAVIAGAPVALIVFEMLRWLDMKEHAAISGAPLA